MAEEKETKGRQLKIKGLGADEEKNKGKKEDKKERKLGVVIVLVVSIVMSILFSLKADGGWLSRVFEKKAKGPVESSVNTRSNKKGFDLRLFGPAVYEYEK